MIGGGVVERQRVRSAWLLILAAMIGQFLGQVGALRADVFSNVPEAADYTLVHGLTIPNASGNFNANGVPYHLDNSGAIAGLFDRIAYYVELQRPGGDLQFAYASMDAFTQDATKIGVPTIGSGAFWQQAVSNMNVVSNVPGLNTGTRLAGNIEFWPGNYNTANVAGIPGASDSLYDSGDSPGTGAGYGSMQIHNTEAAQTVFAYNRWGTGRNSDLGIGNNTVLTSNDNRVNPDWTFRKNAGDYQVKSIHTLVREADRYLALSSPTGRAVFQRNRDNEAAVSVEGVFAGNVSRIEARAVPMPGYNGTTTDWQTIDAAPTGGSFTGSLTMPAGWYRLEVRAFEGATPILERTVDRVGVGEVFVMAGQSNSANSGSGRLTPTDDRVSVRGPAGWRLAADPQPIATGSGGSPWPAMGDALADMLDVPIGFMSVGQGGTRVDQWLPGGTLYPRLENAIDTFGLDGFRAILWHQGESDAGADTSTEEYVERLEAIIAQSRADAGWDVPWGVALASYRPKTGLPDPDILEAQLQVIAADPLVFLGANTDDMIVPYRNGTNYSGIHFNVDGLNEHGQRWAAQLYALIVPEPSSALLLAVGGLPMLWCLGRKTRPV